MKKIIVAVIIIVLAVFFNFIWDQIRVDSRIHSNIVLRKFVLEKYYSNIIEYYRVNECIPESFYEVCKTNNEILYPYVNSISSVEGRFQGEVLINDPNLFEREVEYVLIKNQKKWFLMERNGGHFYKGRLMIDDQGNCYKIEKIGDRLKGYRKTKKNGEEIGN